MGQLTSDIDALDFDKPIRLSGRVSRFDGHIIECDGFPATIGTLCQVDTQKGETTNAEVIGFEIITIFYQFMTIMRKSALVPKSR